MKTFLEAIKREGGATISYGAARLADGTISVSLGGDYEAPPNAISDEVEGITFYWYAEAPEFAELEKYIVDTLPPYGPTSLLSIDDHQLNSKE